MAKIDCSHSHTPKNNFLERVSVQVGKLIGQSRLPTT